MKKYILSSIILLLAAVNTAWAQNVAKIVETGTEYATLAEAFGAVQDGETIELLRNYDASLEFPNNSARLAITKSITIEGNNYTLTVGGRGLAPGMNASSNVSVTMQNITIQNSGSGARCVDTRGNLNTLNLTNVTLKTDGATSGFTQPLTIGGNQSSTATVNITNSTIQTNEAGTAYYAIITFNPVNMTIENSTIKGWACIYAKGPDGSAGSAGSEFSIKNGSKLISKNEYSGTSNSFGAIVFEDDDVTVNISGSTINVEATGDQKQSIALYSSGADDTDEVNINASAITLTGENATYAIRGEGTSATQTHVTLGEGTTSNEDIPDDYIDTSNSVVIYNGVDTYTVGTADDAVAKIGDRLYATLQAAVEAATAGQTIELLTNIDLGSSFVVINGNKAVTIDGGTNQYEIKGTGSSSGTDTESTIVLQGSGAVTLKNLKITNSSSNNNGVGIRGTAYSGKLTIDNCIITVPMRGVNVMTIANGFSMDITGSTIQSNIDAPTTTYVNDVNSRGISFSDNDELATAVTITDTKIQGFKNDIYVDATKKNLTLTMNGVEAYGLYMLNLNGANNTVNLNASQNGATTFSACTNGGLVTDEAAYGASTNIIYLDEATKTATTNNVLSALSAQTTLTAVSAGSGKYKLVSASAAVAQIGTTKYETLQAAIDAAEDWETIDILSDIQLTTVTTVPNNKYNVNINKSVTINGNNHTITSSSSKRALAITGEGKEVTLKDLTVTGSGDWAIGILNALTCTLDNVHVDGSNLAGNYTQPLTIGGITETGHVTLNITNGSVIETKDASAHYAILVAHPSDITVTGSTLKGWANVYLKPDATGSTVDISNSTMVSKGVAGSSNNFAMITLECENNTITLTDNDITTEAQTDTYNTLFYFNTTNYTATGNTVKVLGSNTSYTSNNPLYGGFTFNWGALQEDNNNNVYFDAATKEIFTHYIDDLDNGAEISETTVSVGNADLYPLGYAPEVYYYWTVNEGTQGTYTDFATPFTEGWLADGEFIKLMKDVTISDEIYCQLEEGNSFYLELNGHSLTRDANVQVATNYLYLDKGVTLYTDVEIDGILYGLNDCPILKSANDDATYKYKYTVVAAEYVAHINGTLYESLAAAVAAAQAGDVITMIADDAVSLVDPGSEITISKPITITGPVDENGLPLFSIWGSSNGALNNASYNDLFIACSTGTVTISNLSLAFFGDEISSVTGHSPIFIGSANKKVVLDNVHICYINCEGVHINGGEFEITNCVIDCYKETESNDYTKGICVVNEATGSITGTKIENVTNEITSSAMAGIELQGKGPITISDCEISTNDAGKCIGICADSAEDYQLGESSVTVSNTTVTSPYYTLYGNGTNGALISVTSGTYNGPLGAVAGTNSQGLSISGGTYNARVPMDYLADNYICPSTTNNDGRFYVTTGSYVAKITFNEGTEDEVCYGYETLAAAVAAAGADDEIILLDNITLDADITCNLEDGEALVITFGAFDITKGDYSVLLPTGVSVITDKSTDIFSALVDGKAILEEVETVGGDVVYTYSVADAVAVIGETPYATLAAAIAAVPADGTKTTITMIDNETVAEGVSLTVPAGKNIVLDLNGKTVAGIGGTSSASFYFITNKGTLEITDNSTDASGKITHKANSFDGNYSKEYVTIYNLGGTLTLTNGTVENTTGGGAAYAINNSSNAWGTGDDKETVFNMTGGTISAPTGDAGLRVYQNCAASDTPYSHNTVNISGGTIASGGIFLDNVIYQPTATTTGAGISTNVTISGGEIHGLIDMKLSHSFNTNLNITGGTFVDSRFRVRKVASQWSSVVAEPTAPVFTISGGKFSFVNNAYPFSLSSGTDATTWSSYTQPYYVSGGVFNVDLNNYSGIKFPTGNIGVDNTDLATKDDYPYTVGGAAALIGDVSYGTLEAALAAAQDGETITLLKNTSGSGLFIGPNKFTTGLTIDFNNYTYTVNTPVGSTNTVNQALHFEQGNKITLTNGGIKMTDDATELAAFQMFMQNYGTLIIDGMSLDGTGIAVATYSGYSAPWEGTTKPQFNYNTAGSSVIRNSTITMPGDMGIDDAAALTIEDDAVINVNKIATKGTDARYESATATISVENGAKFKLTDADGAGAFDLLLAAQGQTLGTPDANGVYTVDGLAIAQIGETTYPSLAAAIAAVPTDGTKTTIKMIDNETVAANTSMTIAATKNIVLDLNGKTITGSSTTASPNFYFITNKGTLEITDNTESASGKITYSCTAAAYSNEYVTICNEGGTFTLTKGTIENTSGGLSYAVNNRSVAQGTTTFNLNGGTVSAPSGDAAVRVYQSVYNASSPYDNIVNVTGGTILDNGIFVDSYIGNNVDGSNSHLTVNISGGTVNGLIDYKLRHPYNTSLNITDGTFGNSKLWVRKYASEWKGSAEPTAPIVTISGGQFQFANGKAFGLAYDCGATSWTSYTKPYEVSGGIYNVDLNDFSGIQFPTGMMGIDNTDPATSATYPYTVGLDAVATIGNARYATLKEAFEAVQDGETIKLLKDVNLNSGGTGSSDNNNFICPLTSGTITLDYNGHTISASNRFIRLHNGVNINTNLKYNGDASRPTYFTNADANSIVIAGLIDQTDKYFKVTTLAMTADVPYVDENGANQTTYAAPLTSDLGTTVFLGTGAHNTTTWYYLADDASFTSLLFTHNNTANLILTDDKTMTVSGGPLQGTNSTKGNVGIYGQENQTGTLNLSWGGNRTIVMLSYTQNGGNVVSNGSFDINTITVNEGNLSVTGNGGGYAPLGRTNVTEGSSVTINGGKVDVKRTATSGSNKNAIQTNTVTITGGELTAESTNTAIYAQGNITITGGKTTVKSNDDDNNYGMEAGGSITMSLTKNDEYINSINGKYRAGGSITIPNGLYAQGTGDFYQGTVAAADIDNKKLVLQPYEAVIDFGGTTGEVFYLTLAEADDHDENGTYVIRLLHNIESPYVMRTTPDNTMRIFRDGRRLTIAAPRGYIVKAETNEETVNVDGVPVNNAKVTTYTSIPVNVAIDPATYNGTEQTPNVTITMLGQGTNTGELTLNTDYKVTTVSETGYTNAAEYVDAIRIQGIVTPEDTQESGYIADIYSNFTILPLNLPDFTITAVAPYVAAGYGANNSESGAAVLAAATISIVDGNGKDWTNLGIFTVTIDNDPTATNNYNHTGSYQGVVHITPKVDNTDPDNIIDYSTNFTGVIPAGNLVIGGDKEIATSNITATVIYTGSAQKPTGTNELYGYPTVIVKDGMTNAVLVQGTHYDLEYDNTYGYINAQTYASAVTIRGINDYHGVKTVDYIITPKNIADCTINASTPFTGSTIVPANVVTVVDGERTLSSNTDANTNVNDYSLTVSGGFTYLAPQTYANAITVTGMGNYTGSVTKDFVITSTAAIDLATAAVVLSKQTYTGANLVPTKETTSVTVNGTPLTEGTDYTFSFIPEGDNYYMDAKTYSNAIIIKAKEGNATYYGTAVGNYIIEPRDLSDAGVTVTATDIDYNNTEKNVTVTVKYGENVIPATNYTFDPTKVTEAGLYDVTVTAVENSNLVGSRTVVLKVTKALNGDYAADFTVEPDPIPTQTYTGSEIRPTIVVKDKDRVMQLADANGGDYSVAYSDNINEGMATITITGRYAYSGTITKHFYIINEYFTVGDFTYHHAKEGEEVNLGKKAGGNNVLATTATGKVEVPETVEYPQGHTFTVTGIEEKALGGADITAVVLPQSIAEIEDNAFQGAINTRYVDASAMSGYVPETLTRDFDGPFGGLPKQALVYLTGTNIKGENYVYKPGSGDAYYCELFKIYDDLNGSQTGFDGNDYKWAFENVHKFTAYTVENTRMLTAGKHYTTCLPYSIDIPRNVKAYTLDATSGQIFGFKEIPGSTIAAYTPYVLIPSTSGQLLSATDVEVDVFPADATTDATKLNGVNPTNSNFTFYGTMRYMEGDDAAGKYIMQYKDNKSTWLSIDEGTAGFNESNRACILPMRAYIASTTGGARSFTATFTDIDGIIRTETFTLDDEDTVIYDLSGRRVELLEHGHTYIINGKKVIVK